MKNQKLFKLLSFALTVVVFAISMSACMKEEDYYTKSDVESLIDALETKLSDNKTELSVKIAELKAEYEAKVTELNGLISANSANITALETELNGKIADAKADYEAKISGISELIAALQNADTENVKKLAALEAKVEEILARHEHSFGEWFDFENNDDVFCENRVFYHVCEECNVMELKRGSYENHKFVTVTTSPTCVSGGYDTKTCEICGKAERLNETPTSDHTWKTEYSNDNSFHWFDCEYCDADNAKAEHNIDESGYCTVCEAPLAPSEGIAYDLSADGTYAEVIGYNGAATKINIASEYNGVPVKSIYNGAFKNSKITSVVIPDSVLSLGSSAFSFCTSLTSVVIPDRVESIGSSAFRSCTSLTSVVIPDSVTSLGNSAFQYCDSLTSVVIGDSVTSIGDWAFGDCSSLTSVVIPDSVTSIGYEAFISCDSLTSVVIGDSVTSIREGAFKYCDSLTSVVIGDSATSIGYQAFHGCNSKLYTEYEYGKYVGNAENPYAILIEVTNKNLSTYKIHESTKIIACQVFSFCARLTSITIPDSVTSIGNNAFYYCTSLTSVVIPDSVESIGYEAFYYGDSLKDVYYTGSEEQWNNITIGSHNYDLTGATKHFNYVKED